jgi:transposase InsO family protein
MVTTLHANHAYPVAALCRLLDVPRSRYYYAPVTSQDTTVSQAVQAVAAEFPTYGSRRMAAQLRRAPYKLQVNRKQVQRLMREMGLVRPVKRRVRQTTNSQHPWPRYPNLVLGRQATLPDEVWMADITYVKLQTEFVYLAVVMDLFTRTIRGWQLSRWLDQGLTLEALQRALTHHGPPQIHHSDQGVQYAARAYVEQLRAFHIKISMADVGAAWQNGYAERIIRTIKEEEIDLADYQDFADAYAQIGHFIEQVYQHKRIHSALGYLTPAEFEADWRQLHPPSLTIA